jgi:hypothetical protein
MKVYYRGTTIELLSRGNTITKHFGLQVCDFLTSLIFVLSSLIPARPESVAFAIAIASASVLNLKQKFN